MPTPEMSRRRMLQVAAAATAGAVSSGTAVATTRRFAAQERALSAGGHGMVRVLWNGRTDRRLLALSFDDGPSAAFTPDLLDTLAELELPATFFLVGQAARARPDLVQRIVGEGHEVGNHTDTHINLGTCTLEQARVDIHACHQTLLELTGSAPRLFRPPYGAVTGAALRTCAELGYDLALWTYALREQQLDSASAGNAALALEQLRPGTVLLAHDAGGPERAVGMAAVPQIVAGARQRGYELVTVSQVLAADTSVDGAAGEELRACTVIT